MSKVTLTYGALTLTVEDPDGIQAAIVLGFAVQQLAPPPQELSVEAAPLPVWKASSTVSVPMPSGTIDWDAHATAISQALTRQTMSGGAA